MTQVVGLVALILLLAFSSVLFALASAALGALREGDMVAVRSPLTLFTILTLATAASILTWAKSMSAYAATSVSALVNSLQQTLASQPLSFWWLGAIVALVLLPGFRKWIANNYLVISVVILGIALVGGVIASSMMVGGSWSIIAMFVLVGIVVGLGNQGLVFIPRLDDGPRLGESTLSALRRIITTRIRRAIYDALYSILSIPEQLYIQQTIGKFHNSISARSRRSSVRRVLSDEEEDRTISRFSKRRADVFVPQGREVTHGRPQRRFSLRYERLPSLLNESYFLKRGAVAVAIVMAVTVSASLVFSDRSSGTMASQTMTSNVASPADVAPPATSVPTPGPVAFKIKNTDGQGIILREQPSRNSKPVGSLLEGATVEPVGSDTVNTDGSETIAGSEGFGSDGGSWRRVKDSKGNIGWTLAKFLEPVYAQGKVKITNTGGEGVLLRVKPGKTSSAIGMVREGQEFRIIGPDVEADGKTWRNVSDDKGLTGWVFAEYLSAVGQ